MKKESHLLRRIGLLEFLHFGAWQTAVPIIPLYLAARHYDSLTIGLVVSAFGIAAAILGLVVGTRVDRWGPRRSQRIGLAGMAAGATLLAASRDYLLGLVMAQVLLGLAQLLVLVADQSWLAAHVPASEAQKTFGWLTFASGAGWIVGPLLGGFIAGRWGFAAALWAAALLQLLPLAISLSLPEALALARQGGGPSTPLSQSRAVLGHPPAAMALMVTFSVLFAYSVRDAILPLFLEERGFTTTQIGFAIGAMGITSVGIRPFLGLVGRHSWSMLVVVVATAGLGLALLPVSNSLALLLVVALLLGLGVGMSNPMTTAIISQSTPPEYRGLGLSLRFVANRIAQFGNPLFLGWLATITGLKSTFLVPALLMGGLAVLMSKRQPEEIRQVIR